MDIAISDTKYVPVAIKTIITNKHHRHHPLSTLSPFPQTKKTTKK